MKKITKKAISTMLAWSMTLPLAAMPKAEEAETTGALKPVIANEDFESYAEGTKLSETGLGWTVKDSTEGDKVTIEKDTVSNSKAVRIEQTKQTASIQSNPTTGFILDGFGDKITEGIVDISFKMRRETAGAQLPMNFLGIENQYKLRHCSGDMYFNTVKWDEKYWGGNSKATYTTWNITYDFENDKLMINSTNGGKINISHDPVSYSGMQFLISANFYEGAESWIGGEDGVNPVYWVDDIKVTRRSVEAENSTENVCSAEKAEISFEFNCEINDKYLTDEYFLLYENGNKSDNFTVTKSTENPNRVLLKPENGFVDGYRYKAVAKSGLESKSGGMIESQSEYIFEVKIEKANVIAGEDFESYAEGTKLSETGLGWTVKDSTEGDKVTIEKDTVSNSKAVRIEQKKQTASKQSNPTTGFILDGFGDKITEGIVDISFKMRRETAGAQLPMNFLGIEKQYKLMHCGSAMYFNSMQWDEKYWGGNSNDTYTTWNITYDFENDKLVINSTNGGKINISHDPVSYSGMQFLIAANYHDGDGTWIGGEDGVNPVYWVDDIKVTRRAVEIENITPNNDSAIGLGENKITVKFNEEIADEFLKSDYFEIYMNDVLQNGFDISKNATDKTIVEITGEFELNKNYKIVVKNGIKSEDFAILGLLEDYVSNFKTEIQITDKIAADDFDEYENGTKLSKIHSNWNVADSHDGDSVTVETDPQTNQKALKIVQKQQTYQDGYDTGFRVDLGKKTSGVYKVSMKIKAEKASSVLNKGMLLSTGYVVGLFQQYKRDLYINTLQGQYVNKLNSDSYTDIEFIVDVDNKKYKVLTNSGMKEFDFMKGYTDFTAVNVMITSKDGSASGVWLPDEGEESVYWIDNFCVEQIKFPEVKWTAPVNKAQNVITGKSVELYLNNAAEADSVTKENIKLFKNGEAVEAYNVRLEDYTKIIIILENETEKNSEYSVEVCGLKMPGSEYEMNKTYTMSFKTADKFGLEFSKIYRNPTDGSKFSFTYDLYNYDIDGTIDLVFASYGENGKLLSTVIADKQIKKGEQIHGTAKLLAGDSAKCFVWNGMETMSPISEPIKIEMPDETTYGIDVIKDESKDINIAFIGGSITAQEQWITPLRTYFNQKFNGRKVNYTVAGVGGTGSDLQTYRVYEDIIKNEPDLVFVDATINDSPIGAGCANTYEAVIRQLQNSSHQPSVISVAFGSQTSSSDELWKQTFETQKGINDYYGIPTINILGYIQNKVDNGELVWKNDGNGKTAVTNDGVHPNEQGGKICAEYIKTTLENDFYGYVKKMISNKTAKYSECENYVNSRLISWRNAEYKGDWKEGTNSSWLFHDGSAETTVSGSSVTLEFYGKSIAIYNNGGMNGMNIEYNLDNGKKTGTVSSFQNSWDWNQVGATSVISADKEEMHTITFTAKDPGTDAPALIFGYFLVR